MTNPVVLYGTQSNGETLPVQVDATGRLIAEGLPGPPGPEGPQGPQGEKGEPGSGGGAELPPDPTDGALLGWMDGELVWFGGTEAVSVEYLMIGGGGARAPHPANGGAGGGAGGLRNSRAGELSGGGQPAEAPLQVPVNFLGTTLNVSVGAAGQDSILSGPGFSLTALAGGNGDGGWGGCGGGQQMHSTNTVNQHPIGESVDGQGYRGGTGGTAYDDCLNPDRPDMWCHPSCISNSRGGGGGGAGGPGSRMDAGPAYQSSITGTPTYFGAGGRGWACCVDYGGGATPIGDGSPGSGQGWYEAAQPGCVIIRFPKSIVWQEVDGDLSIESLNVGDDTVVRFNGGTGRVKLTTPLGRVLSPTFNLMRQT